MMKTVETITSDPDTDAIISSLMTGKPIPDDVRNRLREEGRKLTEEIRRTCGETNVAVDIIRQSRDE